jgi:hypothetical protein
MKSGWMKVTWAGFVKGISSVCGLSAGILYTIAFRRAALVVASYGLEGFCPGIEKWGAKSSIAMMIASIAIASFSLRSDSRSKILQIVVQGLCMILILFSFCGVETTRSHLLLRIEDHMMRMPFIQEHNKCCNWDGKGSFLEIADCGTRKLCKPVFEEAYDGEAPLIKWLLGSGTGLAYVAWMIHVFAYIERLTEGYAKLGHI